MTKKVFVTYGSGAYVGGAQRLYEQAKNTNLFDDLYNFDGFWLKEQADFWDIHADFFLKNHRGHGYWLWKPYMISSIVKNLNDDDIVLYLDAGCEIQQKNTAVIQEELNKLKTECLICTGARQIEKMWNKMDLIEYMNMKNTEHVETEQHQSGLILFRVCPETRRLVKEWYETACNYHFIDDTPSVSANFECFREHRHDQSVLSLLIKKYDLASKCRIKGVNVCRNRSKISRFPGQ